MATSFPLPPPFAAQRWKLKIRDRERCEPPHVTVLHNSDAWRYGLREGRFLDKDPPAKNVPEEIVDEIKNQLPGIIAAWDKAYPHNPVSSSAVTPQGKEDEHGTKKDGDGEEEDDHSDE